MVLLLVGAIVVVMGLVVFWVEPLGVLGVLEWLTASRIGRRIARRDGRLLCVYCWLLRCWVSCWLVGLRALRQRARRGSRKGKGAYREMGVPRGSRGKGKDAYREMGVPRGSRRKRKDANREIGVPGGILAGRAGTFWKSARV